jgi:hypothetical protein
MFLQQPKNNESCCREPLLKGNAQYSRPPCTNKVSSATFDTENSVYSFTRQATLMRRSTVLSLPLQFVWQEQHYCAHLHHRQGTIFMEQTQTQTHSHTYTHTHTNTHTRTHTL